MIKIIDASVASLTVFCLFLDLQLAVRAWIIYVLADQLHESTVISVNALQVHQRVSWVGESNFPTEEEKQEEKNSV